MIEVLVGDLRYEKNLLIGIEKYPSSVKLLLELADNYYRTNQIKKLAATLSRIEALKAEESPVYYAKLLEFVGLSKALSGDSDFKSAFA